MDTTGDGGGDGSLTLERLTYQADVEVDLADNGRMELDSDWPDIRGAEPSLNERSTTHVDTGTYSRHVIGDTDQGIEGNR